MLKNRSVGIVLSYTSTILNMVAGLFLSSFLLRWLGDFEYGLYQTVSSFISYLVILEFGVGTVMCRNLLVAKNSADPLLKKKITSTMWYFSLILSMVIILIGVIFMICIPYIYAETIPAEKFTYAQSILLILLVFLICSFLTQTLSGAFLGNDDYTTGNIINIVKIVLRTGLLIALVIPFNTGFVIASVDAGVSLVILAVSIILVSKKHGYSFNIKLFDKKILKGSLMLCFALLLQTIVNQTNGSVGKFIIGIKMDMESVALYSIPTYIFTVFSSFTTIPVSMYMPQVARDMEKGIDGKDLEKTLVSSGKLITLIGGSIVFGFAAFGKQFISVVYGASYVSAWLLTLIILIPMLANLASGCVINVLDVMNKRQMRSYILFGSTILTILLTVFLIDVWGLIGVAVAMGASTIIGQVIVMNVYYGKGLKIKIWKLYWNCYARIIPCQVIAMLLSGLVAYFIPSNLIALVAGGVTFVVVEFLCLMIFGFNRQERKVAIEKLRKAFSRNKKPVTVQNGEQDDQASDK